jgi:hypothetical protein
MDACDNEYLCPHPNCHNERHPLYRCPNNRKQRVPVKESAANCVPADQHGHFSNSKSQQQKQQQPPTHVHSNHDDVKGANLFDDDFPALPRSASASASSSAAAPTNPWTRQSHDNNNANMQLALEKLSEQLTDKVLRMQQEFMAAMKRDFAAALKPPPPPPPPQPISPMTDPSLRNELRQLREMIGGFHDMMHRMEARYFAAQGMNTASTDPTRRRNQPYNQRSGNADSPSTSAQAFNVTPAHMTANNSNSSLFGSTQQHDITSDYSNFFPTPDSPVSAFAASASSAAASIPTTSATSAAMSASAASAASPSFAMRPAASQSTPVMPTRQSHSSSAPASSSQFAEPNRFTMGGDFEDDLDDFQSESTSSNQPMFDDDAKAESHLHYEQGAGITQKEFRRIVSPSSLNTLSSPRIGREPEQSKRAKAQLLPLSQSPPKQHSPPKGHSPAKNQPSTTSTRADFEKEVPNKNDTPAMHAMHQSNQKWINCMEKVFNAAYHINKINYRGEKRTQVATAIKTSAHHVATKVASSSILLSNVAVAALCQEEFLEWRKDKENFPRDINLHSEVFTKLLSDHRLVIPRSH